ncbi:hypothetical protein GXW82_06345 [Streptacidiphilus sp. 4-A2]|nr:hypothetical protein [Streptacidiphilus sp. 4-A2]
MAARRTHRRGAVRGAGRGLLERTRHHRRRTADRFYHALFGYTQEQIGDGRQFDYTAWKVPGGQEPVCGRLQASAAQLRGGPSAWGTYFAVADVDAAAREVSARGGTVLGAAVDSPFGRMCPVLDPSGAAFTLCTLPA